MQIKLTKKKLILQKLKLNMPKLPFHSIQNDDLPRRYGFSGSVIGGRNSVRKQNLKKSKLSLHNTNLTPLLPNNNFIYT